MITGEILAKSCVVENFKKSPKRVRTCVECIKKSGDPFTAKGQKKLKLCKTKFLPKINKICKRRLKTSKPKNQNNFNHYVYCFARVNEGMLAKKCLAGESSKSLVEAFTNVKYCTKEKYADLNQLWKDKLNQKDPVTQKDPCSVLITYFG